MTISTIFDPPLLTDSTSTFNSKAFALVEDLNTWSTEANALAAGLGAISAGTAAAVPYTFSTTTADADPGVGYLRLDHATQNLATTVRADLVGADGSTWTDLLNTFDDSTSAVKGQLMLVKLGDASKWLVFNVSALASPTGYKNITVAAVAGSAASPFANGDSIVLKFTRTGDKGDKGDTGLPGADGGLTKIATVVASNSPTVVFNSGIDSTYKGYSIEVINAIPSTDAVDVQVSFSIDGGANWLAGTSYSIVATELDDAASAWTINTSSGTSFIKPCYRDQVGSDVGEPGWSGTIRISDPANTSVEKSIRLEYTYKGSTLGQVSGDLKGRVKTTSAINAVKFQFSGGDVESGVFILNGIKS